MSLRNHGRSVLICCGLQASTQHTDHECPNACRGRTTCWTYLNYSLLALPNWPQVHGEPRHHRPALPHHGRRDHPGGRADACGCQASVWVDGTLGLDLLQASRGSWCCWPLLHPCLRCTHSPLPVPAPTCPPLHSLFRTPWSWAATTTRAMRRWAWFL